MTAAKRKAIIQEYLSAYNAFDVEAMLSSVHHDDKFQISISSSCQPDLTFLILLSGCIVLSVIGSFIGARIG
jgi:hypothetical protein